MKTKATLVITGFLIAGALVLKGNHSNNPINTSPKGFIENKGQWDDNVLYLAQVKGLNIWITKTGVTYDFFK